MNEESKTFKTTQKILNKLISEEIIAGNLYNGAVASIDPEYRCVIEKKFREIAVDELQDHAAALEEFALRMGFEVPFKNKDLERHASKKMVNALNNLKKGEEPIYYIDKGIESEIDAIKSYEECLDEDDYCMELQSLLLKCYYEEVQHLRDLQLLRQCAEIGVQMA